MSNSKPVVFLDFDGVVETIYWEKDKDGSWSFNIHKIGRASLNNKQAIKPKYFFIYPPIFIL